MRFLENKVPPPILLFIVAGAMWAASWQFPHVDMFGELRWGITVIFLVLALIGPLGIREFVRAKTTIDPVNITNASSLVTSGAFSITRNPMYVSMTALLIAEAIYLSTPWVWLGPLFYALFIDRLQIAPEERAMAAKFGEEYDAYRARVRRWL